jgi:hypothetical protein
MTVPKLAPDVAAAQAEIDETYEAITQARDEGSERRALAEALERARANERAACIAALENLDRTGREWVRGSLWSEIFRAGLAAIRARGDQ